MVMAASQAKPAWTAAMTMMSLLQKPLKGGTPAMDREAMVQVVRVTGIRSRKPPISFSCRVPVANSMEPEQRNRSDLNTEWLTRWKIPPNMARAATLRAPPQARM